MSAERPRHQGVPGAEGEWKNDIMHGKGLYTYTDGTVYNGQWVNGTYTL